MKDNNNNNNNNNSLQIRAALQKVLNTKYLNKCSVRVD